MDLKQLANFVRIVELQSYTKAAASLGVAQPALSRQIKNLEAELGVSILERHGWGASATPEGLVLLDRARGILKEISNTKEAILAHHYEPRGSVTLGMPTTFGLVAIASLVQRTRKKYPGISLRIVEGFSASIHEWLVVGRLDVAVLYAGTSSRNIVTSPLVEESMVAIGTRKHITSHSILSIGDMAKLPLILPGHPHRLRLLVEEAFLRQGEKVVPMLEIDALPALVELAACGEGCTILPYSALVAQKDDPRLEISEIEPPGIERNLLIGTASGRPLSRPIRLLRDELHSIVREEASRLRWRSCAQPFGSL